MIAPPAVLGELEKLGCLERGVRAVMERVMAGKGSEIGFGAMTEIMPYCGKGLHLVGPLPAELQNHTSYAAAMAAGAPHSDAARAFPHHLATSEAKSLFAASGIE